MTPQARRACVTLYQAGWHVATIAVLARVHPSTVTRALNREGIDIRGRWGT